MATKTTKRNRCVYRFCPAQTEVTTRFFSFPKDRARAAIWLNACKREDLQGHEMLHRNYQLCEKHFDPQFIFLQGNRKTLSIHAIPTIFDYMPESSSRRKYEKNENKPTSQLESPSPCRFCLEKKDCLTEVSGVWQYKSNETIKDKLLFCIPQLTIVNTDPICHFCIRSLKITYKFINQCLDSEKIIKKELVENSVNVNSSANEDEHYTFESNNENEEEKMSIEFHGPDYYSLIKSEKNIDNYTDVNGSNNCDSVQEQQNPDNKSNMDEIYTQILGNDMDYKMPINMIETFDMRVSYVTPQKEELPPQQEEQKSSARKKLVHASSEVANFCLRCSVYFPSRCEYQDHMLQHKKKAIKRPTKYSYNCQECSQRFRSYKSFGIHLRAAHGITDVIRRHIPPSYSCTKCLRNFLTRKELVRHETAFKNRGKCGYTCERCQRKFLRESEFEEHRKDVADAPCCNYVTCILCPEKFTQEEFKDHCIDVHPNFVCQTCNKSFPSKESLTAHLKVHATERFMCDQCGKVVKTPGALQVHISVLHTERTETYSCNQCSAQFKIPRYLKLHVARKHGVKKKDFVCETCGRPFAKAGELKLHIVTVHEKTDTNAFICPECNKTFPRKDYMIRHLRWHTQCMFCKMKFKNGNELSVHIEKDHDENQKKQARKLSQYRRPCVCTICNKVLANNYNLEIHYKVHFKIRKYRCAICKITLQSAMSLKNHMKIHEDPDHFSLSCIICHVRKTSKEELEKHVRETHKTLKYECKHCNMKFGRKHLLYSHEATEHQEVAARNEELFKIFKKQDLVYASEEVTLSKNMKKELRILALDADDVIHQLAKTGDLSAGQCRVNAEGSNSPIKELQMGENETKCGEVLRKKDNA
ncbi:PR domain zinc finger protein 5-like [Euwallacea fornicatus]|uniref:PR domain zinc finger protein 5-like n=1 Tax=Euwallacea fornicatus TaxID=995702 RepID=UPI00338D9C64